MRAFILGLFAVFLLAGCGSAGKRRDSEGAARARQCGDFCRELDRCLGSEFRDSRREELCELARCESGCRPRIRSAAGYEGAFQFASRTWAGVCGKIFVRRGLGHCRPPDARNDLCCAAICAAEMIADGGIGHWPTCGGR